MVSRTEDIQGMREPSDEDETPQVRPSPLHMRLHDSDPAKYLLGPPTEEEAILLHQLGLHIGDSVPAWMFARLAVHQRSQGAWISDRERTERKIKRTARWAIATLAANLALLGGVAYSRIDEGGAAREHAANVDRMILQLREEISELRLLVWKRYGAVQDKGVGVVLGSVIPTEFSNEGRAFASCDSPCSASVQCRDAFSNCNYCYQGKCSAILPAQPEPVDAGVADAAK